MNTTTWIETLTDPAFWISLIALGISVGTYLMNRDNAQYTRQYNALQQRTEVLEILLETEFTDTLIASHNDRLKKYAQEIVSLIATLDPEIRKDIEEVINHLLDQIKESELQEFRSSKAVQEIISLPPIRNPLDLERVLAQSKRVRSMTQIALKHIEDLEQDAKSFITTLRESQTQSQETNPKDNETTK